MTKTTLIDIVEVVRTLYMEEGDRGKSDAPVGHTNQVSESALTLAQLLQAIHLMRTS